MSGPKETTNTKQVKRVALVGAGGVGKTTLLKFFQGDGFTVMPSITREYYKTWEIANESAYMELPLEKKALFQIGMRDHYMKKWSEFVAQHPDKDIVTDRSIFDHLAYGLYNMEGAYNLVQLQLMTDLCMAFANSDMYTHLIYIPYPQPWMTKTSIGDGFRMTDPTKNYIVSSIMLSSIFLNGVVMRRLRPNLSVMQMSAEPPEVVYKQIQEMLNPKDQDQDQD